MYYILYSYNTKKKDIYLNSKINIYSVYWKKTFS